MYADPNSLGQNLSARSVSRGTTRSCTAVDERLKQNELLWKQRLATENYKRQEAAARAHQIEEQRRLRAEHQLQMEEQQTVAAVQRNAAMQSAKMAHKRSESLALQSRLAYMQHHNELRQQTKQTVIEEKLAVSVERHNWMLEQRRQQIAHQRANREAHVAANQRKVDAMRQLMAARVEQSHSQSRSASRSPSASVQRHRVLDDQLRTAATRAAQYHELRRVQLAEKHEELEHKSQQVLVRRQSEIEMRRQRKAAKEMEVRQRVAMCERYREMNAQRFASKFEEAKEVGARVAAFNSTCRAAF